MDSWSGMPRKPSAKKAKALARAAKKRAARKRSSQPGKKRTPAPSSRVFTEMNAELAQLVADSPISKREIDETEEEVFLHQVMDVNAKAVARDSGVKEGDARLIIEALVQAGTLELREDLHLVPTVPLSTDVEQSLE